MRPTLLLTAAPRRALRLLALAGAVSSLTACAALDNLFGEPAAAAAPGAPRATAVLRTPQGQVGGQVDLVQVAEGVQLTARVAGLTPGPHGFHIHANGVCAPGADGAAFGAAGGHFDPYNTRRHGAPGRPATVNHAGDMPNIPVGAQGRGTIQHINRSVTLRPGPTSALGRTIVVHAGSDDYVTDPAGNSGPRVLCGVIQAAR